MASIADGERMKEADGSPSNFYSTTKTKSRWTREETTLRNAEARQPERQPNETDCSMTRVQTPKRTKKYALSAAERLLQCAEQARSTGSVHVQDLHEESPPMNDGDYHVHVETYCRQTTSTGLQSSLLPRTTHVIHVQPLLILDLNGILCHRIRHHQHGAAYRRSAARIANTPVVPRVDLHSFLAFLDEHFCLAVWTSAKRKTAKQLVNLLFPTPIRDRLLFVWAQHKCHAIPRLDRSDQKPLFQKPLQRVWNEYALWNASNTYLMDDSPKKCSMEYSSNTLHPPPLHGQQGHMHYESVKRPSHHHGNHTNSWHTTSRREMSDLENERRQLHFFQQFVKQLDGVNDDDDHDHDGSSGTNDRGRRNALEFLEQHGRGHMGWRGPSKNSAIGTVDNAEL